MTDPVSGGTKTRIGIGAVLPLSILVLAAYVYLSLPTVISLPLPRKYGMSQQYLTTTSPHARWAITAIMASTAAYFHFRWYWGLHRRLTDSAQLMTMLAMIGFGGSFLWLIATLFLTS